MSQTYEPKPHQPTPETRSFADGDDDPPCLRLTPSQWRAILESRSFLDHDENRFQHPRRFLGAVVQIIPDESFR